MKKSYLLTNGYIILVPEECSFLYDKYVYDIFDRWENSTKKYQFSQFVRMWMYNTEEDFELIEPK